MRATCAAWFYWSLYSPNPPETIIFFPVTGKASIKRVDGEKTTLFKLSLSNFQVVERCLCWSRVRRLLRLLERFSYGHLLNWGAHIILPSNRQVWVFTIVDDSNASTNRLGNMKAKVSLPTQWPSQNLVEQSSPTSILMSNAKVIEAFRTSLQKRKTSPEEYYVNHEAFFFDSN